ncbi:hypothetical protein ACFV0L_44295 [Streptosporangium canum]|uniref:hypothetical protein n=1 Tax=Streptosporangium canum TaxID=324952 RepID=UPI0036BFB155
MESWFLKLCESDPDSATLVEKAIDRLADVGPALGRPLVDTLEDNDLNNLKELRQGRLKQVTFTRNSLWLNPWSTRR